MTTLMTRKYLFMGLISLILFVLSFYFFASGSWLAVILLVLGFSLLCFELLLPTMGILGLLGGGLIYFSLWLLQGNWLSALIDGTLALAIAIVTVLIFTRLGFQIPFTQKIVLDTSLTEADGFQSLADSSKYLYQQAITVTDCRPVGKARFSNGQILEVFSQYHYIEKGSQVEVVEVKNDRLLVTTIK
ncbi:nodulation efficiency protein D [Aerococcus sp. CDC-944-U94]|uniref:hypothetical protein n=1 Tax=Aerococcus urinae (strain CCUG 59500 / ACS-120-V-Col10a) TaxID=2976812 RepID=UPI00031997E9|nr:hypothetical protein [Aerococcus sp. Group 1]MCY3030208.1 nodulation efficiency protein D [Aerococcus sp. Group 1]MCY3054583.1 nodulation efficiency protein D [Aerococcus sp. Group 1]MCY3056313.1 nodulation efficiency protein D [Aerococcus sp. Group 1]MCY3062493.1 nodulation efficiency protein D [Aerococcus sp. Group 1]